MSSALLNEVALEFKGTPKNARSEANAAYLKLNGSLTYFTTDSEAGWWGVRLKVPLQRSRRGTIRVP